MKKVFIYFFGLIFLCFILPAILTKRDIATSSGDEKNEENILGNQKEISQDDSNNNKEYEYKKYGIIRLLHAKTGEIEELPIDTYLYGVVSAEMPADFELEALKSQAVVARTYTIYKIKNKKHENADICDDSNCCQAWISKDNRLARWDESKKEENWQKIERCVNETKGKIITFNNEPINAFFHSNSGGKTEIPVNVWGGNNFPYLQSVETSGEEGYSQYNSEVILGNEDLINKLKTKYQDIQINFDNDEDIKIIDYTNSGRVKTIKFGNHELSGTETRGLLGLKSTNFEIVKENQSIKFIVKGYGHGVGMSQTGSNTMAKEGKKYEDIIHHFYTNVEIKDINSL